LVCSFVIGSIYAGINIAKQHQNYEMSGSQGAFLKDYVNWTSVGIDFAYGFGMTTLVMSGASGLSYFGGRLLLSGSRTAFQGIAYNKDVGYIVGTTLINMGVTALLSYGSIHPNNVGMVFRGPWLDNFMGGTVSDAIVITTTLMITSIFTWTGEATYQAIRNETFYGGRNYGLSYNRFD
jgi:hypothetical protein